MATSPRRTVLTGLGVISPVGLTLETAWSSLREGRTGIAPITSFDVSPLPCRFAGEVKGFDAKAYVDKDKRKGLRMMARTIQLGVAASQMALDSAGLKKGDLDPTRFGVEFGSGLIATEPEDMAAAAKVSVNCQPNSLNLQHWGEIGMPQITPLWMLKYLPNMAACHVSIIHDAQGPNNSITESDVASLLALGEAARIIGRDQADIFLTGGCDSKINTLSLCRHMLFLPLSKRNDAPEKACRPFDLHRDGTVIGEGSTVFALEELEHARRRGARIFAEVAGFGAAFDRKRTGAGIARACRAALAEAGVTPEMIDHVNAHGLSTPEGDAWEARGLREVFGDRSVPVWAVKAATGNLGAAAGATELAASVLALHHGCVPATVNYETPDPACPVAVTRGEPRRVQSPYALKVGMTDLGQCAAVVIKKWE
jgi:3-oxoacyl-[acyl-carrier-protein] synthase II